MAFGIRYGLFESIVMPFGLTNTSVNFQEFINNILPPVLDIFCTAFVYNILIYSNTIGEHKQYLRAVL
jgi:hypothetical protein